MLSKHHVILCGLIVFQSAGLVAMDKKPESPRIAENWQNKNPLSCSAELRSKDFDLQRKTAAINIAKARYAYDAHNVYYIHCGSHSPVESTIPYYNDQGRYYSDCP